ncbi:TRAP transporter small permease [Xanthobacter sp. DSM 24535]|uniref:TRAP transporter small permease n=1 Tax=Roseixanthobacter psychrophilus TaxID=3119917 RepID=UPI003728352B
MGADGGLGAALRRGVTRTDTAVMFVNRWLMILALAVMAVFVFVGVALRYLSNGTLVWAEESSRYIMVWLAFIGIGPVLRVGGHVAVDSLVAAVSLPLQRALRLVVALIVAGCTLWLLYAGWAYVARSWYQTTPVLGMPFALVALAAPVGFALCLWHLFMMAGRFVAWGTFDSSDDLSPEQAPTA